MEDLYNLITEEIKANNLKDYKISQNQFLELHLDKERLTQYLQMLRDSSRLSFTILSDCFAADFLDREKRFEVCYNLFSLKLNDRIIIKTYLGIGETIPSVSSLYSVANWYEREIFDLFGIEFNDHPDMRRLLTDYGFVGHPLRKDFPLTGYLQVKYDETLQKVIYEPVKLDQEYRYFDTLSPWQKNPIDQKK
jgi:NADH-quinone oxidoreductase subunit C